MKKRQVGFLGDRKQFRREWQEWKGMPEFSQEDLTPWKTISVHFKNKEDIADFAKAINQRITVKTRSTWYPKISHNELRNKRYVVKQEKEKNES